MEQAEGERSFECAVAGAACQLGPSLEAQIWKPDHPRYPWHRIPGKGNSQCKDPEEACVWPEQEPTGGGGGEGIGG